MEADLPDIFVNPNLPNYFLSAEDVAIGRPNRSYVDEYESAKVIAFSNVKPNIDFTFWQDLDLDKVPGLKKLAADVNPKNLADTTRIEKKLASLNIGEPLRSDLLHHMVEFYKSIIPTYMQIFRGYDFMECRAVWRLTTTLNENMHVDTYREPLENHFARMFVNIDTQPRIWQTSWTIDHIRKMQRGVISRDLLRTAQPNAIWAELNRLTFGGSSKNWWDSQPRHVAYFNPGDVWIVDSRQVAHQIFYGRRAISIDFVVDPNSMINKKRQYLRFIENFRDEILAEELA